MSRITDYPSLAPVDPADVLPVVDVSDTTQSAAGTTKQATLAALLAGLTGQFLCAPKVYAPASQTALAVTTTSLAAFSSGSVCTNSFTAPPSGSVLVRATFVAEETTSAGKIAALGVAAAGTTTPLFGSLVTVEINAITSVVPVIAEFPVTGLTPGNPYQFDLVGAVASGNFTILAVGTQTLSLVSGGLGGPVTMTVQAA